MRLLVALLLLPPLCSLAEIYPDYYKVLGVPPNAPQDQINSTYHQKMEALQRRIQGSEKENKRELGFEMAELRAAYERLETPESRKAYDKLKHHEAQLNGIADSFLLKVQQGKPEQRKAKALELMQKAFSTEKAAYKEILRDWPEDRPPPRIPTGDNYAGHLLGLSQFLELNPKLSLTHSERAELLELVLWNPDAFSKEWQPFLGGLARKLLEPVLSSSSRLSIDRETFLKFYLIEEEALKLRGKNPNWSEAEDPFSAVRRKRWLEYYRTHFTPTTGKNLIEDLCGWQQKLSKSNPNIFFFDSYVKTIPDLLKLLEPNEILPALAAGYAVMNARYGGKSGDYLLDHYAISAIRHLEENPELLKQARKYNGLIGFFRRQVTRLTPCQKALRKLVERYDLQLHSRD